MCKTHEGPNQGTKTEPDFTRQKATSPPRPSEGENIHTFPALLYGRTVPACNARRAPFLHGRMHFRANITAELPVRVRRAETWWEIKIRKGAQEFEDALVACRETDG